MRVGDRYRWVGPDGALWLRNGIYQIAQVSSNGRMGRITTRIGDHEMTRIQVLGTRNWQLVEEGPAPEPEKYIGVVRSEDGVVRIYSGWGLRNGGGEGRILVFPDEATAIQEMSLTSEQHRTVDYYLVPVRAVRHIRNGEVQDAV